MSIFIFWALFLAVSGQLLPPDLDLTVHEGSGQDADTSMSPTPSESAPSASATVAEKERRPTDTELVDNIFWPDYDISTNPILFFNNARPGYEIAEVRARHPKKLRLEFVCYNEDEVICLTEDMKQGDYRMRMVLVADEAAVQSFKVPFTVLVHDVAPNTGADITYHIKNYTAEFVAIADENGPSTSTSAGLTTNSTASHQPLQPAECPCQNGGMCKMSNTDPPENYCECTVDFFGEHCETRKDTVTTGTVAATAANENQTSEPSFEQETYDAVVLEGFNKEASTVAIIKYKSSSPSALPKFTIANDHTGWFEIGGVNLIPEGTDLIYAITLKLRASVQVGRNQPGILPEGLYIFTLEADEPPYHSTTSISTEILSVGGGNQTSTVHPSSTILSNQNTTQETVESSSASPAPSATIEPEEPTTAEEPNITSEPETPSTASETGATTETEGISTVPATNATGEYEEPTTASTPSQTEETKESTSPSAPSTTEESIETTSSSMASETGDKLSTTSYSWTAPIDVEIDTEPILSIDLSGEKNGRIMVSEGLDNDDYVPGFKVIVSLLDKSRTDMDEHLPIELSTDSDIFFFKPKVVLAGRPAFLIVNKKDKLDFETAPPTFLLQIFAQILGHPNTAIKRTLEVDKVDVSDTAPEFVEDSYSFSVLENSITGTAVGRIFAKDKDKVDADKLTYELIGDGSELFAIHDGAITVSCLTALPCLDRENQSVYHLIGVVKDSAGLDSLPTAVVINIADKNDNGPRIVLSTEHIEIVKGQLVMPVMISITDEDISPNNESEISLDGSASTFFVLKRFSSSDYRLKLAALPNPGDYTLVVTVKDGSGPNVGDTQTMSVSVRDTISRAQFRRVQYDRTVNSEKLVKGNPLVQLELEGIQRDTVRFYIIKGSPGWLSVDPESGDISVGDVPASGVPGGKHEITVAAVDRITGLELAETAFSLIVIGKRQGSVFLRPMFSVNVDSHTPQPQAAINLLNPGDKVKLMIVPESIHVMDDRLKAVDVTPSVISVVDGKAVLMLPANHHLRTIQFQVSPEDDLKDRALVTIYLSTKVEEMKLKMLEMSRPLFSLPWKEDMTVINIKLPEETLPGYTIVSLPAHDPVTGLSVTDLKLTGSMAKFFQVNQTTGDISVNAVLDYEKLTSSDVFFEMTLTAGTAPYTTEAILKVEIVDIDDNTPTIKLMMDDNMDVVIPENTEGGTLVYALKIKDMDRHITTKNNFKYELLGDGASSFQLKELNGTLVVAVAPSAILDYETQRTINLVLNVKDSGKNVNNIALPINITDVNDNAPVFAQPMYVVQLVENWPVGATVIKTSATDADSGDNGRITYALQLNEDKYFEIDENTGEIRTARPLLNLARAEPYLLRVMATDNGQAQSTTSVDLRVSVLESTAVQAREEAHLQLISPPFGFVLRVEENTVPESKVYTVEATYGESEQSPSDIKYSLVTLDGPELFDIDSASGDLFTLLPLDREKTSQVTAELNKTKAKHLAGSTELVETNDHDCSFSSSRESGYYSVEHHSPCKEYASNHQSQLVSPRFGDEVKAYNRNDSNVIPTIFKLPLVKQMGPAGIAQIDLSIPDFESTAKFLIKCVNETKYVTAIFEAPNGGIDILIADILSELQMWFEENGLLGIACEVHWSVPEKKRDRAIECRMKEGIHAALRKNNRKVMDLKNDKHHNLPLMLAESSTQENSFRQTTLNCFQGVYRRFYDTLLPYQHKETVEWHEPFWSLSNTGLPQPNPEQFLMGKNPSKLEKTSLVAVNLIALQVTKKD